jgi:hypothetical protein
MAHCLVAGIRSAGWSRIGEGLQIFERMAQSLTRRTWFSELRGASDVVGHLGNACACCGVFCLDFSSIYIYFYIYAPRPFNAKYASQEPRNPLRCGVN